MSQSLIGTATKKQELVLAFFLLLITTLLFVLFAQEKLLYYLIGMVVLVVVAWAQLNIRRWIYLVFIFMPLSPNVNVIQLKLKVSTELDDFVVWFTIIVFLLNTIVQPKMRRKNDFYLLVPLGLYLMACAFNSILAFYFHQRLILVASALGHLFKWASYVFIYFIILRVFSQERDFKNLLKVILVAFGLGAIVTVYRYHQYSGGAGLYRAGGLMEGLNSYAMILAILLTFYFNLILLGKSKELFPTWLVLTLWIIILIALVTTFSRGAWFTLWGCLIAISFLRRRRYIAVILVAIAMLNFLFLRGPVERRIRNTFVKQPGSSLPVDLGGRDIIWKSAIRRIGFKYILVGIGYSNFGQVLMGTTAHNQYLAILGESGLFGLAAFVFFLFRLTKTQIYLARHHPLPFFRECALGNLTGIIALILASFAGEFFYFPAGMAVFLAFYATSRATFQMANEKLLPKQPLLITSPIAYQYGWHQR